MNMFLFNYYRKIRGGQVMRDFGRMLFLMKWMSGPGKQQKNIALIIQGL